jgi:hypothetical protein
LSAGAGFERIAYYFDGVDLALEGVYGRIRSVAVLRPHERFVIVPSGSHESGGHVIEMRGGAIAISSRQYVDRVRALLR